MARDGVSSGSEPVDLGPWLRFPVAEVPRPIVLLSPPVQLGQGFVDEDAKSAWLSGAVVADVPLPVGVLELATAQHGNQRAPTVVHISSVERCTAAFLCDRGERLLPAYRLAASAFRDGCVVLDPNLECWWPPRGDWSVARSGVGHAQVDDDDLTVHFPAFGGVLTEFHHAEFIEYETCVVGRAVTTEREVAPGTAVPAVGISRHVVGHLERPLAGRVLLNRHGRPLAVVNRRCTPTISTHETGTA